MARSSLGSHFQHALLLVLILDLFCQVVSDYCGNDQYCQPPSKCCTNSLGCCYDHGHNGNSYVRGFKLQVWNMWYFWLVVIFILMSCFGGCGYYRRQRLASLHLGTSTTPTSPRRVCVPSSHRRTVPPSGLYAYTGPGADNGSTAALPPPYTEVMQQPSLYPVNKAELPPYPGPPLDKGPGQVGSTDDISPPPYCEVAMPAAQLRSEGVGSSSNATTTRVAAADHISVPVVGCMAQDECGGNTVGGGSAQASGSS